MKELVVISGKGGTGKTSIAASLAVLARSVVVADCDVDAADLHLVLSPRVLERHEFRSGHEAVIRPGDCARCGYCLDLCRFGAIRLPPDPSAAFSVDPTSCEGCGACVRFCPAKAIDFPERVCGEWMVSETRVGPMVHARLGISAENSGKLVSVVRREARNLAEKGGRPLVLVDGPPGIGCPVIASVTGASLVLAVTEPTVSGEHDLERVLSLARHFGVPVAVCVNKWDINPGAAERIEASAAKSGARDAGRIRYDPGVTRAQLASKTVVEIECPAAADVRAVWERIEHLLEA
ncbi:MAG: ATP-binding protein [Planctomycetes bacterium]|nr:ATP-binding protein [Planctomycetota bacterium]